MAYYTPLLGTEIPNCICYKIKISNMVNLQNFTIFMVNCYNTLGTIPNNVIPKTSRYVHEKI